MYKQNTLFIYSIHKGINRWYSCSINVS